MGWGNLLKRNEVNWLKRRDETRKAVVQAKPRNPASATPVGAPRGVLAPRGGGVSALRGLEGMCL